MRCTTYLSVEEENAMYNLLICRTKYIQVKIAHGLNEFQH